MSHHDGDKGARPSAMATVAVLGSVLYVVFSRVDDWASVEFAQAPLASMLVAVIDLGLFAVALCLAPALSSALARLVGRMPR